MLYLMLISDERGDYSIQERVSTERGESEETTRLSGLPDQLILVGSGIGDGLF